MISILTLMFVIGLLAWVIGGMFNAPEAPPEEEKWIRKKPSDKSEYDD